MVNLSDGERQILQAVVQKGKSATRSQTRARILLKAAEGSRDKDIIDALNVLAIDGGKDATALRGRRAGIGLERSSASRQGAKTQR